MPSLYGTIRVPPTAGFSLGFRLNGVRIKNLPLKKVRIARERFVLTWQQEKRALSIRSRSLSNDESLPALHGGHNFVYLLVRHLSCGNTIYFMTTLEHRLGRIKVPNVGFLISYFSPPDLQCFDFSHEKLEKSLGEINPMVEFMPHSTSGSPFTLSHLSNFATPTPPPSTTDPLQYLLEALNRMPLVNGDGFSAPTIASTQQSTEKEETIQPSPVPQSTGVSRRGPSAGSESDYEVAMRHYEDVVNTLFKSFKTRYQKSYVSRREHETRKDIYRHNLR